MNCLCQDGWLSLGPRTTCGKEIKNLEQRDRMAVPPALWSGIFSSPCLVWSCLYTSLPFVVVQFLVMCFFHTIYFLSCSFPSPNSSHILPTFLPSNFMFSLSPSLKEKKKEKKLPSATHGKQYRDPQLVIMQSEADLEHSVLNGCMPPTPLKGSEKPSEEEVPTL